MSGAEIGRVLGRRRRRLSRIVGAAVSATLALGAVAEAGGPALGAERASGPAATPVPGGLEGQFADAAREFRVPVSVLMAVSYQESRWDSHRGQPSATGNYNVMGLTKVDPGDVAPPTTAERMSEVDLRGDGGTPTGRRAVRPSAKLLAGVGEVRTDDPALHTLDAAAALIGAPTQELRTDTRQSIRGGAALLARYQRTLTGSLSEDPGHWFPAVARYSQSPDEKGAQLFASRVFETIRTGMSRVTADGAQVTLPATPAVAPHGPAATTRQAAAAAPRAAAPAAAPVAPAAVSVAVRAAASAAATPTPECPTGLNCNYAPAAYKLNDPTDPASYGNYDVANRPADGNQIRYIVVHDTEGGYAGSLSFFQNPAAYASPHYLIRSADGLVTQMVPTKDIAWHAGNKTINMHAIGIEHEGFAIAGASWYTESEYQSSAALVRYLAHRFGIPLDRQHIIGHDDVPGPLDAYVRGMHWDPGPYWDWNHYMALVGAPVPSRPAGGPLTVGQAVTVSIPFTSENQPIVTDGTAQPAQPADFVYLRTGPSSTAPLLSDPYLRGSGAGTTNGSDWGDKLVTGESFVVAAVQGDWTAVWYGGAKAWFLNPRGAYTAPAPSGTVVVTAASASTPAPVYGRTYPETAAYPATIPGPSRPPVSPLTKYAIPAGQAYVAGGPVVRGDFYHAVNINGDAVGDRTLVVGGTDYRPIRFNHRLAFVPAAALRTVTAPAPAAASARWNLAARDGSGVLWQYQGTGDAAAPLLSRYRSGGGWNIYNALVPLDALRADASSALVARDGSGVLWLYQPSGNPAAPFKARVRVGGGWQIYNTIIGTGDLTGDGRADLVARDASGVLWLYQGTGNVAAPFKARVRVGGGWQIYNTIVGTGDLTGDGRADLVARDAAGVLWLYRGTGNPAAPFASRTQIGGGWQRYKSLVAVRDLNGDGRPDLVGVDANGALWLHPGTGVAGGTGGTGGAAALLGARRQLGTGWSIYNAVI